MRAVRALALTSIVAVALAGCANGASKDDKNEAPESGAAAPEVVTIKVGATPSPHGVILNWVNDNLAAEEGLNIEVLEFTDYIKPNEGLADGSLDANFFQHVPYLELSNEENGWNFEHGEGVHIEPLALYSENYEEIADIPDNAKIGVINDPTNQDRALKLLSDQGFVELPASGDINVATVTPLRGVELIEVEGPALVRTLSDVDAAVINGNFAQEGGLTPAEALAIESTENNPYVNIIAWDPNGKNLEAVKKLEALLHSDKVREFIVTNWPDQSVIPAF